MQLVVTWLIQLKSLVVLQVDFNSSFMKNMLTKCSRCCSFCKDDSVFDYVCLSLLSCFLSVCVLVSECMREEECVHLCALVQVRVCVWVGG